MLAARIKRRPKRFLRRLHRHIACFFARLGQPFVPQNDGVPLIVLYSSTGGYLNGPAGMVGFPYPLWHRKPPRNIIFCC